MSEFATRSTPHQQFIAVHYPFPNLLVAACAVGRRAQSEGAKVTIVDLGPQSKPHTFNARNATHRLLEQIDRQSRRGSVEALCKTYGFDYFDTSSWRPSEFLDESSGIYESLPEEIEDLVRLPGHHGLLGRSLANWLTTTVTQSSRPSVLENRSVIVPAIAQFLAAYEAMLCAIQSGGGPSEAVIWNGRLPRYAAPWAAALEAQSEVMFYEKSGPFGRAFALEQHSLFDREESQRASLDEFERAELLEPNLEKQICDWLDSRRTRREANLFLQTGAGTEVVDASQNADSASKSVTMFTSSPDELVAIPGDWTTGSWSDQATAFTTVGHALMAEGYDVTVRIHPNIANKSWVEYFDQIRPYIDSELRVFLPTDPVDSYALVRSSCAVFVWASTIGLESAAMGIPTYVLGASYYDESADVRKLCCLDDLYGVGDIEYQVDPRSVLPMALRMMRQGSRHELDAATWALAQAMDMRDQRYRWLFRIAELHRIIRIPRNVVSSPRPLLKLGEMAVGRNRARRVMAWATRRYIAASRPHEHRNVSNADVRTVRSSPT